MTDPRQLETEIAQVRQETRALRERIAQLWANITIDYGTPESPAINHDDLLGITADNHHTQVHDITGADHTASGLSVGEVIRASGATTFAWATLQHADLGSVLEDQHHAAFIGLSDNADTNIDPAADNRIQVTDDGVINADAGTNILALSIDQSQISHDSIGGVSPDDHHAQQHDITGVDHIASGLSVGQVIRATGTTTFGWDFLQHADLGPIDTDDHHAQDHASRHIFGGADEIDGDQIDIDWNPSNYAPDDSPAEVSNFEMLTAHLKGIDDELGTLGSAASPGGSDTQVQFNDGGSFGGDAGLTWDKTNDILTVQGAAPYIKLEDTGSGKGNPDTPVSIDLIVGSVTAEERYFPGIRWLSSDANFTTTNPKPVALIQASATESYSGDSDGGATIRFYAHPSNPGTAPTFNNNDTMAIGHQDVDIWGNLSISQDDNTAGVPALTILQDDVSEELINASIGSDGDMTIIEVDVTGTPQIKWDEAADQFVLTKGLSISDGGDLFPTGATVGVTPRLQMPPGDKSDLVTHHRGETLPGSMSWAGSPFATPGMVANSPSDYLQTRFTTGFPKRGFAYASISNSASSWQNQIAHTRVTGALNAEFGLRIDVGNDNTYAEIYVDGSAADATTTVKFRYRVGGGSVTTNTSNIVIPAYQFISIAIYSYYNGADYFFYGYLSSPELSSPELNFPLANISGFNTPAVSAYVPAAGRVGYLVNASGGQNPGYFDWLTSTFS